MACTFVTTYRYDYRGDPGSAATPYLPSDNDEYPYSPALFKDRLAPRDLEICSGSSYCKLLCENKRKIQTETQLQFVPGKLQVMKEKAQIPPTCAHEIAIKKVVERGDCMYSPKKINRPLSTTRRLWGYRNPDEYRSGASEFGGVIGYNGYCIAKLDYRNYVKPYLYRLNDITNLMH